MCNLLFRGNVIELNVVQWNMISSEVHLYLNVFRVFMKNKILNQFQHTLISIVQNCRLLCGILMFIKMQHNCITSKITSHTAWYFNCGRFWCDVLLLTTPCHWSRSKEEHVSCRQSPITQGSSIISTCVSS